MQLIQARFENCGTGPTPSHANHAEEAYIHPRWYAIYTRANHERLVSGGLENRGIESFLPLYESVRHWRDRRVRLALPLFPGYVFVHLALRDRLNGDVTHLADEAFRKSDGESGGNLSHMPIHMADNPLDSVALGTGKCVEDFDTLRQVLVPESRR